MFQELPKGATLDLVGKAPLPTLAAFLEKATFFVGNDSGLMHLSAAMGTPTLGLFGPSPENIYAPWGENADYIRTQTSFQEAIALAENGENIMGTLSVASVLENKEPYIKSAIKSVQI